jgi:hypothetical protein
MASSSGQAPIPSAGSNLDLGSMPFSGHYIVLSLIAIAGITVILWIPVLSDHINAGLSRTSRIWAPIMLLSGSALLALGLTIHFGPLAITGGVLIGLVALAFLIDNY